MNKECKVVLLPTKFSRLTKYSDGGLSYAEGSHYGIPNEMIPQHLYIFSDDEIKEGDWCIYDNMQLSKAKDWKTLESLQYINAKKVIATTNSDLIKEGIALIDDEFIKEYCNNPVDSVLVEYQSYIDANNDDDFYPAMLSYPDLPKLSSNGSIIIKHKENPERNLNPIQHEHKTNV